MHFIVILLGIWYVFFRIFCSVCGWISKAFWTYAETINGHEKPTTGFQSQSLSSLISPSASVGLGNEWKLVQSRPTQHTMALNDFYDAIAVKISIFSRIIFNSSPAITLFWKYTARASAARAFISFFFLSCALHLRSLHRIAFFVSELNFLFYGLNLLCVCVFFLFYFCVHQIPFIWNWIARNEQVNSRASFNY